MRLYSAPMATFPRYAIYHVAAPGTDLDRFGAKLLGYDAYSSEDLPFPEGIMQIASDWRDLTKVAGLDKAKIEAKRNQLAF